MERALLSPAREAPLSDEPESGIAIRSNMGLWASSFGRTKLFERGCAMFCTTCDALRELAASGASAYSHVHLIGLLQLLNTDQDSLLPLLIVGSSLFA